MRGKDTPLIHAVRALRALDPGQRREALVLAGIDDGDGDAVARDPEIPKQRRKRRKALGATIDGVTPEDAGGTE